MIVGLFFGSFNPVHTGHLLIANYFVQFTQMQQVWFVVSPQNPFKVLKLYNPWLRGKTLTPSANKTYCIELPKDLVRKSIASGLIQNDTIVY